MYVNYVTSNNGSACSYMEYSLADRYSWPSDNAWLVPEYPELPEPMYDGELYSCYYSFFGVGTHYTDRGPYQGSSLCNDSDWLVPQTVLCPW